MGIHDELKKMGYRFEYEHGDSEERTEVWVNEKAGMAVRIEWMRVDGDGWRVDDKAVDHAARPAIVKPQRNRHHDDDAATSVVGTRVLP